MRYQANAEAIAVYAAEDKARTAAPRPLRDARAVTALVRRIERLPQFDGVRVRVQHGGRNMSIGGLRYTRGKKPSKRALLKALRERSIEPAAARSAWDASIREYFSRPLQNEYFVCIAPDMRDALTVTHEMAHVLQAMQVEGIVHGGRLGHGKDFLDFHRGIVEALDPEMARALQEEYVRAGLEVVQ